MPTAAPAFATFIEAAATRPAKPVNGQRTAIVVVCRGAAA